MNGQRRRQDIVRELTRTIDFGRVVETGTYRGASTIFFSALFGVPVSTVEANRRFHSYSRRRIAAANPNVDVVVELGDSRAFLQRLASQTRRSGETVFFYLDAHWNEDLPLAEELRIISRGWTRAVVMIDDFQVPDDAGYGYDNYGPGRALVEEYLPADLLSGWSLYYPAARSSEETGGKRGVAVLISPALAGPSLTLLTLRFARTF